MRAGADRCHQHVGKISTIGAIPIEKQNDAASLACRCHSGGTGSAVAALSQRHDACARRLRNRRRAILAGTVGDNDLVHHIARQHRDRAGDRFGLVQRGDDGSDAGQRCPTDSTAAHTLRTAAAAYR